MDGIWIWLLQKQKSSLKDLLLSCAEYYNNKFNDRFSGSDLENLISKLFSNQFNDSFSAEGMQDVIKMLKNGCSPSNPASEVNTNLNL